MTHQDKLKAVIDRAIKNGWDIGELVWEDLMDEFEGYDLNATLEVGYGTVLWFIFEKAFLQAFFGKEQMSAREFVATMYYSKRLNNNYTLDNPPVRWEYHGQQLVLSDNHLDYLYSFIEQAK